MPEVNPRKNISSFWRKFCNFFLSNLQKVFRYPTPLQNRTGQNSPDSLYILFRVKTVSGFEQVLTRQRSEPPISPSLVITSFCKQTIRTSMKSEIILIKKCWGQLVTTIRYILLQKQFYRSDIGVKKYLWPVDID